MCHKAKRIIRNRLKLEACKMMGDKLSTVGIYVMKIKAKEKNQPCQPGSGKYQSPFNGFGFYRKKRKKEKKKTRVCAL